MNISSRFAVAIHILSVLEMNKAGISTSDYIAESVNTNPVVIRRIVGMLSKAGLVEVKPGVAGAKLAKHPAEITLLDIYHAVHVVQEDSLFSIHENSDTKCPVGKHIQTAIVPVFSAAQKAMENTLHEVSLEEIIRNIYASANGTLNEK
ncbi:transcriptional regulator, BadM/Rrf2 family protein [Paenibacillus vortex V453]|uniref:Rrf2 family transcriptional regulator n=2 Tax=Paenibacillus TaxID=44249 RepID=A0A163FRF1_9BACL|nr:MULTISPECIES: Rrf2 family transcriptional regulator [Paenibacillus]EFU38851.1 transcriptional regulator, BadM/Rrf2 family protein [Paenibacillus vortex V453]KZS44530.1 Rrf2 family transcriptional regulator [Paenibacillus glucanolyticus]